MGWTAHWTPGAWDDIKDHAASTQKTLMRAVRDFVANGSGNFVPDGPGSGTGRLIVGGFEIDLARCEHFDTTNDDGEEVTFMDVIVVLSVVSIGTGSIRS